MGGILSGGFKFATGAAGVFGGSPERAAIDETYQSKVNAADAGQLEAQQQGTWEAGKLRMLGSQLISRQRTAYENSGVDSTQGTPLDVMADTRLMSETDAKMAENNAARKVRGFKEQRRQASVDYENQKQADQNNQIGSMLSGAGDLLGAVATGGGGMLGKGIGGGT